jgi:aspartate aminotransferase
VTAWRASSAESTKSMSHFVDSVPFSGIIRIRDMMYGVENPFRLDQGDVSFDAPDSVKQAMERAIADNRSHYLQTAGVPRLQELLAAKLRAKNGVAVASPDEVLVTNGGIHALYLLFQAMLEPGDEVIIPDPQWPPTAGVIVAARGVPVRAPLHESRGWRPDAGELEARVTPRTRAIYLNSPHNPTGGVLLREDLEAIAEIARRHDLTVVSDEAYEDVVFDGEHVSIASLDGMYERTVPVFTFSKTYAMTGLRLGYLAIADEALRGRVRKLLFLTSSNVSSVVQYGGIGALEGSQDIVERHRQELLVRRDLFYAGLGAPGSVFSGAPPAGAFYAFVRFDPRWRERARHGAVSPAGGGDEAAASDRRVATSGGESWSITEYLIARGRIGCIPGADFGPGGEEYLRFCFARDRQELRGALDSLNELFEAPPRRGDPEPAAPPPGSR